MICSHLEAWGKRRGLKTEITGGGWSGVSPNLDDITILDKELIDMCINCKEDPCFMDIKGRKYENLLNKTGG